MVYLDKGKESTQAWLTVIGSPAGGVVKKPPQGADHFLCVELAMMDPVPVAVHQKMEVGTCPGAGGF